MQGKSAKSTGTISEGSAHEVLGDDRRQARPRRLDVGSRLLLGRRQTKDDLRRCSPRRPARFIVHADANEALLELEAQCQRPVKW